MKKSVVSLWLFAISGTWASTINLIGPEVTLLTEFSGVSASGAVNASLVNQTSDNLTYSLTACYDGYCPGQAPAGPGPDFQLNSPLSMKITGFTADLSAAASSPTGFLGDALFGWTSQELAGLTVPVSLSIDGSAPNGVSVQFGAVVSTCDQDGFNCVQLSAGKSASHGPGNTFSGNIDFGNLTFGVHNNIELDYEFSNILPGQNVTMPNSLVLTFGTQGVSTAGTPEPGTLLSLFGGLFTLGLAGQIRRKKQRKRVC